MRSTADLIKELEREATAVGGRKAALIVGFDDRTHFVHNTDPEALGHLNELFEKGGEPVGILTMDLTPGVGAGGRLSVRPLAEYENEEWVEAYLKDVGTSIVEDIYKLVETVPKGFKRGNGSAFQPS